jgi:hypothetical protein
MTLNELYSHVRVLEKSAGEKSEAQKSPDIKPSRKKNRGIQES